MKSLSEEEPSGLNLLDRLMSWIQAEDNPEGVIYGNVTVAAVCAIESVSGDPSRLQVFEAVLVTMLVYWLAHAYAALTATRYRQGVGWSRQLFRDALTNEWAMLRGASFPLLAILLTDLFASTGHRSALAGFYVAISFIVLFETYAARLARRSWLETLGNALVGLLIGCALIALRTLLG